MAVVGGNAEAEGQKPSWWTASWSTRNETTNETGVERRVTRVPPPRNAGSCLAPRMRRAVAPSAWCTAPGSAPLRSPRDRGCASCERSTESGRRVPFMTWEKVGPQCLFPAVRFLKTKLWGICAGVKIHLVILRAVLVTGKRGSGNVDFWSAALQKNAAVRRDRHLNPISVGKPLAAPHVDRGRWRISSSCETECGCGLIYVQRCIT